MKLPEKFNVVSDLSDVYLELVRGGGGRDDGTVMRTFGLVRRDFVPYLHGDLHLNIST